MKLLVVRNDRLGDFMLAWPALAQLRQGLPEAEIRALVPAYTRPLAEICPFLDGVVEDPKEAGGVALGRLLRPHRFDALLSLFSTRRVAIGGLLAGIPYRLAPATKVHQFLYNRRERQRRSRSDKPEWQYNLDLADRLLRDLGIAPPPAPQPPFLRFPADESAALHARFCAEHHIDDGARLVFLHPGSGGSSGTLQQQQWAQLANGIESGTPITFVITAGPGESDGARRVAEGITAHPATVYDNGGLVELARHLAFAGLFIGGSTGPLHLAGALDVPTAGLYPRHRSATALRWQTLNRPDRRLAFAPPPEADPTRVDTIDLGAAAAAISAFLASH